MCGRRSLPPAYAPASLGLDAEAVRQRTNEPEDRPLVRRHVLSVFGFTLGHAAKVFGDGPQPVILGDVANAHVAELKDVSLREALVLGGFAICVLALGVYPKPLTDLMEPAIAQLAMQLANSKL